VSTRSIVDLALAGPVQQTDGHLADLVMLGTLATGRAFWPCHWWDACAASSDFVHVGGPCGC
jgi:hypothetical protein